MFSCHLKWSGEVPFSGHHGCYEFMGSLKAIRKLFLGEKKHMWLPAMISVRAQSCEAALERVTVSLCWCDTLSWSLLVLSQMGNWAGWGRARRGPFLTSLEGWHAWKRRQGAAGLEELFHVWTWTRLEVTSLTWTCYVLTNLWDLLKPSSGN